MRLTLQTQKLKKNLLNYYKTKYQYLNESADVQDKFADQIVRMRDIDLDFDVSYLNKYIFKFFEEKGKNVVNCASDVLSYDIGKVYYPCDYDSIGAYREKKYTYYLDIDNRTYEFPMGNKSNSISLDTVLFNHSTNTMSSLIQDYPQLINYIFRAYEDSKIARIENEKAELIKRIIYMEKHAEELQDDIIALNQQLPFGKRLKNFVKDVFCISNK